MRFRCECGTIIRDQTDHLPYKARFVSDQDFFDLIEALEAEVARVAARVGQAATDGGAAARAAAAVQDAQRAVSSLVWKYAERVIYQCPNCGRLHMDDPSRQNRIFVPADDELPKAMLGSIEGDRWKRSIVGSWESEPWSPEVALGRLDRSDWIVSPSVGVVQATEEFDTWEALEARYREEVERAQATGTLRASLLYNDSRTVHSWPPDEWDERAGQGYTIWIEAEERAPGDWGPSDDETSVVVEFADGSRWCATFVSYAHVATRATEYERSGENLHGHYLWALDMLLVDEVSRTRIEEVVSYLIERHTFEDVFRRV